MLVTGTNTLQGNLGLLVLGTNIKNTGSNNAGIVQNGSNADIIMPTTETMAVNAANNNAFSSQQQTSITAGNFVFGAANASSLGNPPNFLGAPPTYGTQTSDPLSNLSPPSATGLPAQSYSGQSTMDPGVYTGPINFGNGTVTMNPGIYYLKPDANGNAGINMNGNGVLDGTSGVFIYVAPGTGTMGINASGLGVISFNPLAVGSYRGFTVYVDRGWAVGSSTITWGGTPGFNVYGAVYAPTSDLSVQGTVKTTNGGTLLIVNSLSVGGNSPIRIGFGPRPGQSPALQLVE
jgi:hypothetical protein